jgi:hypothetical protein
MRNQLAAQVAEDEMFSDADLMDVGPVGGNKEGGTQPADLAAKLEAEGKTVHANFFNNFGDLFDDTNLE